MSDGISEAYRASRASDSFEKIWKDAQVDHILLDVKQLYQDESIDNLISQLMTLCPKVEIKNYDKFLINTEFGPYYTDSSPSKSAKKIRLFRVEISGKMHRGFTSENFKDALVEALLFAEWIETESGKAAVDIYNDW